MYEFFFITSLKKMQVSEILSISKITQANYHTNGVMQNEKSNYGMKYLLWTFEFF